MKEVMASPLQTGPSSDHQLGQKRERRARTRNIYPGQDLGRRLFKHINGCRVQMTYICILVAFEVLGTSVRHFRGWNVSQCRDN